jgi:hypothetical protein
MHLENIFKQVHAIYNILTLFFLIRQAAHYFQGVASLGFCFESLASSPSIQEPVCDVPGEPLGDDEKGHARPPLHTWRRA